MPQPCTICTHPERDEFDRAILANEPNCRIASRCDVSEIALRRHKAGHIPPALAKATDAAEVAHADTLLGQLAELRADARRIGGKAEDAGDLKTALSGIRELVRIVELTAKLVGELDDQPVVNVLVAPEWLLVRATLLDALRDHPDARTAVAASLVRLEGTHRAG